MAKIYVFPDLLTLSQFAARAFDDLADKAVKERGQFLVSLSGGETPAGLYHLLSQPPYNTRFWWSKTHFFWGDERCVPPNNPENSFGQAKKILFDFLDIPADHIHSAHGEWNPEQAAADYAVQLKEITGPDSLFPPFDLVLLGLGADGHTASLFPGSNPDEEGPVLPVTAQYQNRPANRITLTPPVFNAAREIFFLVSGPTKAAVLEKIIAGPQDFINFPAQRIHPASGQLTWLVDEDAAGFLSDNLKDRNSWR